MRSKVCTVIDSDLLEQARAAVSYLPREKNVHVTLCSLFERGLRLVLEEFARNYNAGKLFKKK